MLCTQWKSPYGFDESRVIYLARLVQKGRQVDFHYPSILLSSLVISFFPLLINTLYKQLSAIFHLIQDKIEGNCPTLLFSVTLGKILYVFVFLSLLHIHIDIPNFTRGGGEMDNTYF